MGKNNGKKFKVYYMVMLLILTLILGFSNTPVIASDTVLEDFDSYIVGTENITDVLNPDAVFNITYVDDASNPTHEVSSNNYYSDPYSYELENTITSDQILMNVSFYEDWSDLGDLWDFSIMVSWTASTCYRANSYIIFYNHTDVEQIKIELVDSWNCPSQDNNRVYNIDNNGNEDLVASGLNPGDWFRIRIRMLSTNVMEQSVYSSTGTLLGAISDSGWRHTDPYTNWTYFHVVVEGANGGAYGDPKGHIYIDDIFITDEAGGAGIDIDDLFEKCTYGEVGYKSFTDYYLESYTKPIGDVTVYAVDLYVNRDQFMYVDLGQKSKYTAYINGNNLSTADYYFQESATMYILRWLCNKSLSESTGVTLEFSQVDMAYGTQEIHWLNLPTNDGTGQEGGTSHTSSAKYGDGTQYGVPFDTFNPDLGLKYCLYYYPNDAVSTNTYNITMWSTDPHAQGNVSQFFVDVTGDNDWWAVWVSEDPLVVNPYEVYFALFEDGEDAVATFNIPVDASIGNWTFYAIDRDLYGFPLAGLDDFGTNMSFNVSDGSSYWGDFEVRPAESQVTTGDYNGFYALAPNGIQFSVRIVKPDHTLYTPPSGQSTFFGTGIAPEWKWSGYQIPCDQEGTWIINIYNASGIDPLDLDINPGVHESTAYFTVSDTLGSSLTVFPDTIVCVGSTVRFQGNNVGSTSYITINYNDEESWSIPVDNGFFDKAFTLNYVGEYQVTFRDISKSVTAETCGGGGGGGTPGGGQWYGLPYYVPYLIGIFITLFITFSPLIISVYITRKTRWRGVDIPPLLYVGFFFMGLITSVLMKFLPVWLPFVILFAMVVYFAVQWLYGSKVSEGE